LSWKIIESYLVGTGAAILGHGKRRKEVREEERRGEF
jgi:hypothetical protein